MGIVFGHIQAIKRYVQSRYLSMQEKQIIIIIMIMIIINTNKNKKKPQQITSLKLE